MMGSVKPGIGFGLWQQGMPDAPTLFDDFDNAAARGIDSVWGSEHTMGARTDMAIFPIMAIISGN
jgi:hypothetical protein